MNSFREMGRGVATVARLGFGAAPSRMTVTIVTELFGAAFSLAAGYALKFVAQEAANHNAFAAILSAAIFASLLGISWFSYLIYANLLPKMFELVTLKLDRELVRLTNRIPTLDYLDQPAYSDKLTLVRQSRQSLANSVQIIGVAARTVIMAAGAITILVTVDPFFLLLPLFAIPRVFAGRYAQELTKKGQDASVEHARLRAHIYRTIASAPAGKEIRVFGLQGVLFDRFMTLTGQIHRQWDEASWRGVSWLVAGDVIFMSAFVAAVGWVVVRASTGAVGIGEVVLSLTMANALIDAIGLVVYLSQYTPNVLITAERLHWLEDFAEPASARPSEALQPPVALRKGIRLEGVSFSYPDRNTPALSNVSLEIPAGGVVALVGENGSGKSTLAKLLCGFYRPTSGRIIADGQDMASMSLTDWRTRVRATFQDYANFEFLLHESVGVGDLRELGRKDLVLGALDGAGASQLSELKPGGLDTMLGRKWGGTELSGGQWQKLALARALFREKPLLVVFDEPTAALDAAAEHEMFEKIAREAKSGAARESATLLISHRFSTVRMADVIAVLDKGEIVEVGPHEALMARGGLYAELFELQAKAYR